jgi:ABC-type multidrug transport system ATPase subunit
MCPCLIYESVYNENEKEIEGWKHMIDIIGVSKKYEKTLANDNISLHIPDGTISILLGPNGAGKSTLIKCITGLLRFKGQILIDSHDNKSIEAKKLLGYVPEMPAVYDLLTVSEHLEFIQRAYRVQNDTLIHSLLERFELDSKANSLGKELSKGMQQKLSICCALIHSPRVLVFDEPLIGLDPHAIKELKNIFIELKNEGATLLISTHMIESVEDNWDNVNIMMQGHIVTSANSSEYTGQSLNELFFSITEGGNR